MGKRSRKGRREQNAEAGPRSAITTIFLIAVAVNACLMAVFVLVDDSAADSFLFSQEDALLDDGGVVLAPVTDTFMDFYNSVWWASARGTDGDYMSIYPPLVNIGYALLAKALPGEITSTDAFALRSGGFGVVGIFECMAVSVLSIIAIVMLVKFYLKGLGEARSTCLSVAFASLLPVVYALERGNSMLACLACLLVFFIFKDSQKRRARIVALVACAIAVNIKLYPAIFLLCLAAERRWKDFFIASMLSVALFVVPLFYFKGLDTVVDLFNNLTSTTSSMAEHGFGQILNLSNTVNFVIACLTGDADATISPLLPNGLILLAACTAIVLTSIFSPHDGGLKWKTALLLGATITLLPSFSYVYNMCFILPGLMLFLATEKRAGGFSIVCLIAFLLATLPIPFGSPNIAPWVVEMQYGPDHNGGVFIYPMTSTCLVNSLAAIALWLLALISIVKDLAGGRREERTEAEHAFAPVCHEQLIGSSAQAASSKVVDDGSRGNAGEVRCSARKDLALKMTRRGTMT